MYKRNIEACSRNHCSRGKAISIACSECVSAALVIQDAKRKLRIIQNDSKRWTRFRTSLTVQLSSF